MRLPYLKESPVHNKHLAFARKFSRMKSHPSGRFLFTYISQCFQWLESVINSSHEFQKPDLPSQNFSQLNNVADKQMPHIL